jgi:hypothetical protein
MKSKEASWKERFAADLLAIRRRVIAEKRLGIHACGAQEPPRVRTIRTRTKAAMRAKHRSRFITDSSYAAALKSWWASQDRFTRQVDLAAFIGVDGETFSSWLNSKKFPRDHLCAKLYAITRLECFSPQQRSRARCEHFLNRAKKGIRRCKDERTTHRRSARVG